MKQENLPHISANKLGEFMFATDAKKRSILKTIKFPSTFKSGRYPEPQSAFVNFMTDISHDPTIFEQKRNQVALKNAVSDYAKANKINCIAAIDQMVICASTILSGQLKYVGQKGLSNEDYDTAIKSVTLHLKPTVILQDKKTGEIKGFIKLAFSKSRAIDQLEAQTILSAIKSHMEGLHRITLKPENCLLLDVFQRRKFQAPKFSQVNKTQLRMLCTEIAELWPTINN